MRNTDRPITEADFEEGPPPGSHAKEKVDLWLRCVRAVVARQPSDFVVDGRGYVAPVDPERHEAQKQRELAILREAFFPTPPLVTPPPRASQSDALARARRLLARRGPPLRY